jgi:hypothetical protein
VLIGGSAVGRRRRNEERGTKARQRTRHVGEANAANLVVVEELVSEGHGSAHELLLLVWDCHHLRRWPRATAGLGLRCLNDDEGRDHDAGGSGPANMGARPSTGALTGSARIERRGGSSPFWVGCWKKPEIWVREFCTVCDPNME